MGHGFSATREDGLAPYAERFVGAGFAVLIFDYRHFGDSAGEPRQLFDARKQLADWAAAISYARSLPHIDPRRIAIFGTSYSGGHVLEVAAADHHVAAVIAQCPVTDPRETTRHKSARELLSLGVTGLHDQIGAWLGRPPRMVAVVGAPGEHALITTPDAEAGFRAVIPNTSRWRNEVCARVSLHPYRPYKQASHVCCPMLLCVCEDDTLGPSDGAIAKVASHAPRAEVKRFPGSHFDIYIDGAFERAVEAQIEFLVRTLQRPATTPQ
jgi:fermentation-respiration switch protein FrsA (DUF1100 family)